MEVGMAAMKTFANPGIDIVKTLPEGIVELVLRGVAIVSIKPLI
jgi:predicted Fe-Mo cluster-binding NifX family protein